MSKRFLGGLILIAIAVLLLLLSEGGPVTLNLLLDKVSLQPSIALFGFMGAGVVIGFMLR